MEVSEPCLSQFLDSYRAKSIAKDKTYFKDSVSPSCTDLSISNNPLSFQNTCTRTTEQSDFQKMVAISLKMSFQKYSPKTITYRNKKKFDNNRFKEELRSTLKNTNNYYTFESTFLKDLNKYAL